MKVKFKKLQKDARIPVYGTAAAAGADLCACLAEPVLIEPGETRLLKTGIAVEIPEGYAGLVFARSGLATKKGLAPANKVGVIDSDYRGELMVGLYNHSTNAETVEPGERIAQMVLVPYLRAEYEETRELSGTDRGEGGFGSTGSH